MVNKKVVLLAAFAIIAIITVSLNFFNVERVPEAELFTEDTFSSSTPSSEATFIPPPSPSSTPINVSPSKLPIPSKHATHSASLLEEGAASNSASISASISPSLSPSHSSSVTLTAQTVLEILNQTDNDVGNATVLEVAGLNKIPSHSVNGTLITDLDISMQEFFTWKTGIRCDSYEDYTGACVYENVCYDGLHLLTLDPELMINTLPRTVFREPNDLWNDKQHMWNQIPFNYNVAPPLSQYSTETNPLTKLAPSRVMMKAKTVEIMNSTVWLVTSPPSGTKPTLPYIFRSIANLVTAQLVMKPSVPPLDIVLYPGKIPANYLRDFFRSVIPLETQIGSGLWIHRKVSSLGNETVANFMPTRAVEEFPINDLHVICAKKMVVVSPAVSLFTSSRQFLIWKGELYSTFSNLMRSGKTSITNKVVVEVNPNIQNLQGILDLLQYYNLTAIIRDAAGKENSTNIYEYVHDFIEPDIYIFFHSKPSIDFLLMRSRAVAIEIFQYGARSLRNQRIANTLGINYIPVESNLKVGTSANDCESEIHSPFYAEFCQNFTSYGYTPKCDTIRENSCIHVPIGDVEKALISAYDILGLNINTRVDQLFVDTTNQHEANDFHFAQNFELFIPEVVAPVKNATGIQNNDDNEN